MATIPVIVVDADSTSGKKKSFYPAHLLLALQMTGGFEQLAKELGMTADELGEKMEIPAFSGIEVEYQAVSTGE